MLTRADSLASAHAEINLNVGRDATIFRFEV